MGIELATFRLECCVIDLVTTAGHIASVLDHEHLNTNSNALTPLKFSDREYITPGITHRNENSLKSCESVHRHDSVSMKGKGE